ncbi:MAG: pitrilysin family protein [Ignavibacteria bacterium]|jgi:predicted Zn-dependent peptidase
MNFDSLNFDRSKPPVVSEARDFKFPKYYEEKLPNGIKIFVIEDRKLPLITAKFVIKAGAYYDDIYGEENSGLSSITSDLLIKGTTEMGAVKIAEEIDFYGASISSGCEYDASYLVLTSLGKYFQKLFDIASSMLISPGFFEDEIEREKQQIKNSLLSCLDEGGFLSERAFKKNVYKNSPYRSNIEGNIKTVENIERKNIFGFFKKFYTPGNLIITIVGDINCENAVSLIKSKFSDLKQQSDVTLKGYRETIRTGTKVIAVEKKGAVQSDLILGHLSVKRNNPDYIPMVVMNTLLGGFFTSRINRNLREVNGYTYGARSYFNLRKHLGDFSVETNVENSLTYKAINEIIFELNKLREENITEDELNSVKKYLTGSFPLQLETPNAIANKIINLELFGINKNFYDTYISNVNSVTVRDIKKVAEKYLHPENLVISIAGNTEIIKKTMEQFADVEVINNAGEL